MLRNIHVSRTSNASCSHVGVPTSVYTGEQHEKVLSTTPLSKIPDFFIIETHRLKKKKTIENMYNDNIVMVRLNVELFQAMEYERGIRTKN